MGGNTLSMAQDLRTKKGKRHSNGQHPTRGTRIRHITNKKTPQRLRQIYHIQKGKETQDEIRRALHQWREKARSAEHFTLLYFTLKICGKMYVDVKLF